MSGGGLDASVPLQRLCWQKDQPNAQRRWPICQTYDLDSVVGFPTSPAVARAGLRFLPNPLRVSNLTTTSNSNIVAHIKILKEKPDGRPSRPLPRPRRHLLVSVLPVSLCPRRQPTFFTAQQLDDLYSNVLIPACRLAVGSARAQHYPLSHEIAALNSLARLAEASREQDLNPQARSQLLSYPILGHQLSRWWGLVEGCRGLLADERVKEMRLLINGKNLKYLYWEYGLPSLASTLEAFRQRHFNMQHWFDLGQETNTLSEEEAEWQGMLLTTKTENQGHPNGGCGGRLDLALAGVLPRPSTPTTLPWPPTSKTVTPSKTSALDRAGLLYSQFYNSIKEIHDAAKHHPFQGQSLESLAQDELNNAIEKAGRAVHRDPDVVAKGYHHHKVRLLAAWRAALPVRYGFLHPDAYLAPFARQPFFVVPNPALFGFLQRSCNRFLYGFEWIRGHANPKHHGQQETQLILMFLRLISYAASSKMLSSAQWLLDGPLVSTDGTSR
ncbi:MAG: hypothetical protein M1816_001652 [Peltula sp. TS41687]|nr:MAG: hypothetical protein M1816_001652 [Peltula sp. TS41687]